MSGAHDYAPDARSAAWRLGVFEHGVDANGAHENVGRLISAEKVR